MRRLTLVLVAAASLVGCGTKHVPEEDDVASKPPATTADPTNFLTATEISQASGTTLYDVIQKLRPNFLVNRGRVTTKTDASPFPAVFLDGSYYGDLGALRNLQPGIVESVRMYRAWEVGPKFGSQYTAGVIAVTSKRS